MTVPRFAQPADVPVSREHALIREQDALRRPHIAALDGVRGIAILLVMLLHFTTPLVVPREGGAAAIRAIFQCGWAGVDLFFALSGFLITGILLDAKGGPNYFRTFYARRVLRIFPLYYLALAVYFVGVPHIGGTDFNVPLSQQAPYWLFLGNFQPLPWESWTMIGHFWSLGIEEQFYLAWPCMVFFTTRRQAMLCCVVVAVDALTFRTVALLHGASGWLVYHYTPGRLDGLALGALVAIFVREPNGRKLLQRWVPIAALPAIMILGEIAYLGADRGTQWMNAALMSIGYTAIATLSASIVAWMVVSSPSTRAARFMSSAPLVRLGAYSYAIYVIHPALLRMAGKAHLIPSKDRLAAHPVSWLLLFPMIMIMVSLAGGYLSWQLYEKHWLSLRRYFVYGPTPA